MDRDEVVHIDEFEIIRKGDLDSLSKLLKMNLNPNAMNADGETLLKAAIKNDNVKMVKMLLENGAYVDFVGNTKETFILKPSASYLLGFYNNEEVQGLTPLMTALNLKYKDNTLISPNLDIVNLLLDYNANVNAVEKNFGLTPLHFAANISDTRILKRFIDAGADVNAEAYRYGIPDMHKMHNFSFTPIALAVDDFDRVNSSECIQILEQRGADISRYNNIPALFSGILSILADKDLNRASNILFKEVNKDIANMDYKKVQSNIETFLSSNIKNDLAFDKITSKLIGKDSDFYTQGNEITYFSQLSSWVGVVAGDYSKEDEVNKKDKHLVQKSEGWMPQYQSFTKIKNLIYILKGIQDEKVDCYEKFGESKEDVMKKLKDEIYHQVTTYYTIKHQFYHQNLNLPSIRALDSDVSLNSPAWLFSNKPDIKKQLTIKLVDTWADKIGKLSKGESFSIYLGTRDHATYMQFRKDDDKNLSRIIYNLGGGSELHPISLDGKMYPHIVKDIPQEAFKNKDSKALSYLFSIINAEKNTCYVNSGAEDNYGKLQINPTLLVVYQGPYYLGGNLPNNEDIKKYIPMKSQIAGNCFVKNNLFDMKNRLGENLAKFVKNFERISVKRELNISDELINSKEIEKDIERLVYIKNTGDVKGGEKFIEKNLFDFFSKRAENLSGAAYTKRGDRVALAIMNAKKPDDIKKYFDKFPQLYGEIDRLANYYNSKPLKYVVKLYGEKYEISKNDRKRTLEFEDKLNLLDKIPSSGINISSERPSKKIKVDTYREMSM
jgi:ankyrin repeat protein